MAASPAGPERRAGRARSVGPLAALSLLLLAPAVRAQPAATGSATVLNRVVLRVNERIVTLRDYRERLAERQQSLARATGLTDQERSERLASAGADVLREALDEALMLSRSDQLSVEISGAEIDSALAATKANFGIENDQQLQMALAQNGLTLDSYRARLRDQLAYREVLGREVHSRITVPEEELQRYWRDHPEEFTEPARLRVQEVVVLDSSLADPAARGELARRIAERVRAGETLAAASSEAMALGHASAVIDLGWVEAGDLDPGLEKAVAGLPTGAVADPVPGRGGDHVMVVVERQEPRLRPYLEVKDLLEDAERQRRFQKELEKYLDELERRAYIVADPPAEAAAFRRSRSVEPELREFLEPVGRGGSSAASSSPPAAPESASPPR